MSRAKITTPTAERIPEPVRNSAILRKVIYRRVHEWNQNFMGVIVGETGKGKSYAALRLAEALYRHACFKKVTPLSATSIEPPKSKCSPK